MSAHHVGDAAHERAEEPVADCAQEAKREQSGEEDVDDESPGHRRVRGHDHPQQERWIENVAVHRRDVREPAEEIRIPEWKMSCGLQRRCRELPERVASDVLIAMRIDEELTGQGGIRERQCAESVDERGPAKREARR